MRPQRKHRPNNVRTEVEGRGFIPCRAWPAILSLFLASCAANSALLVEKRARQAADYYPLRTGTCWSYTTSFQGQKQPDLNVCLIRDEQGTFIDDRSPPSRLRQDDQGLRDGSIRYLLKEPLEVGNKWMSVIDVRTVEKYEIVDTASKVSVPAGTYDHCVVVRMEVRIDATRALINHMSFAPGVGIVRIDIQLQNGAQFIPQSRFDLQSFTRGPAKLSQKKQS